VKGEGSVCAFYLVSNNGFIGWEGEVDDLSAVMCVVGN
jgi:hypothetical protein